VDNAVDLLGSRHGAERRRVPLAAPGSLGFAGVGLLATEGVGLAMLFASCFVKALLEFAVLEFQQGQASAETAEFAVPFLAAGAYGEIRGHRDLPKRWWARKRLVREVLQPRCIPMVGVASRYGNGLGRGSIPGRAKT
jgi:hypothetical protein